MKMKINAFPRTAIAVLLRRCRQSSIGDSLKIMYNMKATKSDVMFIKLEVCSFRDDSGEAKRASTCNGHRHFSFLSTAFVSCSTFALGKMAK